MVIVTFVVAMVIKNFTTTRRKEQGKWKCEELQRKEKY